MSDRAQPSFAAPASMPHGIERNPGGATVATEELLRMERERLSRPRHHPLPLAIVLQFYGGDGTAAHPGDKPQALALARLVADIEPEFREDVVLVLARQFATQMDDDIEATGLYVGRKMGVVHHQCRRQDGQGYPGECYDLWADTIEALTDAYYAGRVELENLFMCEADGCPMSRDWIDRLKRAHQETLDMHKRVTGPEMRRPNHHINGTMVIHASLWPDRPSLHRAPPIRPGWDCFHGRVMLAEANPHAQIIRNEYGMGGLSESAWKTIGFEAAWLTSVKDGLHQHWARKNLIDSGSNWRNPNVAFPR